MGSDNRPPLLGLLGIGDDNRIPARVDLEDDLNLKAIVDRLEIGGLLLFGQLVLLGVFTELAATAQVGIAASVVILADIVDRKLGDRLLARLESLRSDPEAGEADRPHDGPRS